MLMTGDISAEQEQKLVDLYGDFLDSGILKVFHHGSRFSSGDEFLKVVTPDFAVIFLGKYNNYGHPAPETVERLRSASASVFRTDELGAVEFVSDGLKWLRVPNE